jgi:predicted secreted hydrolase
MANKFHILIFITLLALWGTALADSTVFYKVNGPCELKFPQDHGSHPGFRTEWWYYTGNLKSDQGNRYGYQLTFFRRQITPPGTETSAPQPPSAWRTSQIYLAHAAVSDLDGGRYFSAELAARAALGMAGFQRKGDTISVVLKEWATHITPSGHRLNAGSRDFSLTLDLKPGKPVAMHGEAGYSRKGSASDRASCYYSLTRLETRGVLTLGKQEIQVAGQSWMDHEFSTAPLEPGIIGWDWFSLQLSDHSEVMIYLLRKEDGSLHPASSGTYIDRQGRTRHLTGKEFRVKVDNRWKSPHSGGHYPSAWQIRVPSLEMELGLTSNLADQEMRSPESTGVTYWEGSISISGAVGGISVKGQGYAELTGYAEAFDAPM